MGRFLASSWGLKGSLGLAKLEESRVLLEFEHLEEAKRASLSGEKRMGAIRLGFDKWRPWDGCRVEKEESNEMWVRIFGLPVLLWNPTVLRRVGEECGGFIDIDSKTKKLEELQWARILVRSTGGNKPSTLEIEIEEEVLTLALWWEFRPTVKKLRVASHRWEEVRDESSSRAGSRVVMNRSLIGLRLWYRQRRGQGDRRGTGMGGDRGLGPTAGPSKTWADEGYMNEATLVKPQAHFERPMGSLNPENRMGWKASNLGWVSKGYQAQVTSVGAIEKGPDGLNAERVQLLIERTSSPSGPEASQPKRWAQIGSGPEVVLEECQQWELFRGEHLIIWESEEARTSREKVIPSATDKALAEEAMRYDSGLRIERERGYGSSHLILYSFDRTPVGESFDHSGS
ncbi:hypothetical protein CK203_088185 [Vitis vinifera]|uniref:Uncharacterized protein n=1 Tax=Vitis vinifera TaxID=29760 RepID=A0A438DPF2_VITVI|nr:hypothetical protein CK203_088185 [Vitis vinifera]